MKEKPLSTFLNGFYWGTGLMVSSMLLTPLYFFISRKYLREITAMGNSLDFSSGEKKLNSSSGVTVSNTSFREVEDGIKITGMLENSGKDTWDDIIIKVDLFDSDGKFLDQETEYFTGQLEPETSRHFAFQVYCETSPGEIKVYIADADYVSPLNESSDTPDD